MYFLVVDGDGIREQAQAYLDDHKGQMASPGSLFCSLAQAAKLGLSHNDVVFSNPAGLGIGAYYRILHLAFGTSERARYGDIEVALRLMFGPRFLGRSRNRRNLL